MHQFTSNFVIKSQHEALHTSIGSRVKAALDRVTKTHTITSILKGNHIHIHNLSAEAHFHFDGWYVVFAVV